MINSFHLNQQFCKKIALKFIQRSILSFSEKWLIQFLYLKSNPIFCHKLCQNYHFNPKETTLLIREYFEKGASLQANIYSGLNNSLLVFEISRWCFCCMSFKMFVESRF